MHASPTRAKRKAYSVSTICANYAYIVYEWITHPHKHTRDLIPHTQSLSLSICIAVSLFLADLTVNSVDMCALLSLVFARYLIRLNVVCRRMHTRACVCVRWECVHRVRERPHVRAYNACELCGCERSTRKQCVKLTALAER